MTRLLLTLASSLLLLACGSEEVAVTATNADPVDCFQHEATGGYEVQPHYGIEDPTSMRALADECAAAGCIKRETAVCLLEQAREADGWGTGPVGAKVVRMHPNDGAPFLGWEVWSELPAEDRFAGHVEFMCKFVALTGEVFWCGPRAPVQF